MSLISTLGALCMMIISTNIVTPVRGSGLTNYCIENPISGTNYTEEVIWKFNNSVWDLAVSPHTGNINVRERYHTLYVINNTKRVKEAVLMKDCEVFGIGVNHREAKLFTSCRTGLKAYDEKTEKFEFFAETNHFSAELFSTKDGSDLYGVEYRVHDVYKYHNMSLVNINLNLHYTWNEHTNKYRFIVDENGNYYYTIYKNWRELTKVLNKGAFEPVTYHGGVFYNLAADNKGRVYGTNDKGLHRLYNNSSSPQFVTALDFTPVRMCFDVNNNIYFGTSDNKIIIFKYNDVCFSTSTSELA